MVLKKAQLNQAFIAHAPYLRNYMFKLTLDQESAADLVQEAFIRLCLQEHFPPYPRTWLARTGYRLFVDQWRRKQRELQYSLNAEPASSTTPEQALLDREFEDRVNRLLHRLHPKTREVIRLRIYGQLSYIEIARRLGCPENTVKSCMRRGRAKLAKWLSDPTAV